MSIQAMQCMIWQWPTQFNAWQDWTDKITISLLTYSEDRPGWNSHFLGDSTSSQPHLKQSCAYFIHIMPLLSKIWISLRGQATRHDANPVYRSHCGQILYRYLSWSLEKKTAAKLGSLNNVLTLWQDLHEAHKIQHSVHHHILLCSRVLCTCLVKDISHELNPSEGKGNYSAMKLAHWPLMGGLLHLVQRGGDWVGLQPAQAPPRCTKCNILPINSQCTNQRTAV